ncbi:MAG: hypothetical protein HKL82_06820 [Acidimicrobiaceae bacterium]|nr:hypothetical protein [Acidimicrobiaceae bacterium]
MREIRRATDLSQMEADGNAGVERGLAFSSSNLSVRGFRDVETGSAKGFA